MISQSQTMPGRALVLAAGRGVRLRPLTWLRPKPLLPVWGLPMIEHILRRLAGWGVERAVINAHALSGQLRDYVSGRKGSPVLRLSEEVLPRGTGGALRPLRDELGAAPFWIVNADILAELDPLPLLRRFNGGRGCLAAAWLYPEAGPCTVRVEPDGTIRSFVDGRPGEAGCATFCGLQVVSPRIFDYLGGEWETSLVSVYRRALSSGERILGVRVEGSRWDDAGTISRYNRLNLAPPPDTVRIRKEAFPAAAVSRRRRCVIWNGGRIDPGARVRECIVGDHAVVSGAWPHAVALDARAWPDPALVPLLRQAGWDWARTILAPLAPRGSDREFLRLAQGPNRAIYVRYGRLRSENARYAPLNRLLSACGLHVPRLLSASAPLRALMLEDLGERSLESVARRQPGLASRYYRKVIREMLLLHTVATRRVQCEAIPLERGLDAGVLRAEQALMADCLLADRYGRPPCDALRSEWDAVTRRLLREPRVVVHRDLQSSNVLLRKGNVTLIDFQGMRAGPAAYDLASLLYDPYVSLPGALQDELLDAYVRNAPAGVVGDVRAALPWAAVQRLTQALGAYARLGALSGTVRFTAHIPEAAKRLERAAHACGLDTLAGIARGIPDWESAQP